MSLKKLFSNRISLEYSKGEIALILMSGLMLLMLNYLMIIGIKQQHKGQSGIEIIQLRK